MSRRRPGVPVVRVYCSQWVQCGWAGYRRATQYGPQPKPCPQCGQTVVW